MLTDDEIRKLIAYKSERPNLDYREGFVWTKDNRDKKYELIRDLMGMANTQDGGRIILGVRGSDFEFIGLRDAAYDSIDPNNVVQMAHDNSAPKLACDVIKRTIDNRNVVVLDVAEFEDTPINTFSFMSRQLHSNRTRHTSMLRTPHSRSAKIVIPATWRSCVSASGSPSTVA